MKKINLIAKIAFLYSKYLRFDRINEATSAHNGTMPLRVPFTTKATAHAAISLSSTKSCRSSGGSKQMHTTKITKLEFRRFKSCDLV